MERVEAIEICKKVQEECIKHQNTPTCVGCTKCPFKRETKTGEFEGCLFDSSLEYIVEEDGTNIIEED